MGRPRSSPIWKMSSAKFRELVIGAATYTEILAVFGLVNKGGNHRTLKKRMLEEGVTGGHLKKCHDIIAIRSHEERTPLSEILVPNSSFHRGHLKERLLAEGVVENVCELCGQKGTWKRKPLKMVLDHVNGVSDDNTRENLRMVCPNCNSQLPTHCGGNR